MSIISKAKNISKQYRLGKVGADFHPKLAGSFFPVEDLRNVIFVVKNILGITVINETRIINVIWDMNQAILNQFSIEKTRKYDPRN